MRLEGQESLGGKIMRVSLLAMAFVVSLSGSVSAQEWSLYVNEQDGFKINFPGEPTVTATTWVSEQGYALPANVYTAERGLGRYSITAVDYRGIEQQGLERSEACPPGAETCEGQTGGLLLSVIGPGYAFQDIRGALIYASLKFIQRDATVTHYTWAFTDLVEGQTLQLTNADESRTSVSIFMHDNRLYVAEGTVPKEYPEPGLFQQSLGFVDEDGNGLRYETVYSNEFHGLGTYPPPPLRGRGGGAGPAGAANPAGGIR